MRKGLIIAFCIILLLPTLGRSNTASGKGSPWITVVLDGSNDFDLCNYLGVREVNLWGISQGAVTNGTLRIHNGNGGSLLYGPFIDTSGTGLHEYGFGWTCKPYIVGTEATSGMIVTFAVIYVTQ